MHNSFLQFGRANVLINVTAQVISPPSMTGGSLLPWKLVKITVKNLTAEVNHVS